ncbi:MAG: hypothetical protein ACRC06_08790 [Waterburya sp.]
MNLSFKDLKFILEAIEHLLSQYNSRLEKIEEHEKYEDEASDLSNDCMFLEFLKSEIEQNMNRDEQINLSISSKIKSPKTLESLTESTLQLSINERLFLVEAITQSIRKETNLIAS